MAFLAQLQRKTAKKRELLDSKAEVVSLGKTFDVRPDVSTAIQCDFCQKWLTSKSHHERHIVAHPSLIAEGSHDSKFKLYLGNEVNANNLAELQSLGIKRIVNVAADAKIYHEGHFNYLHLMLRDVDTQVLSPHFTQVLTFLNEAQEAQEPTLVHCVQGISRSASFVAAYLMTQHQWRLKQALAYMRARRSIVGPNRGFLKELLTLEVENLGGEPSVKLKPWTTQVQSVQAKTPPI